MDASILDWLASIFLLQQLLQMDKAAVRSPNPHALDRQSLWNNSKAYKTSQNCWKGEPWLRHRRAQQRLAWIYCLYIYDRGEKSQRALSTATGGQTHAGCCSQKTITAKPTTQEPAVLERKRERKNKGEANPVYFPRRDSYGRSYREWKGGKEKRSV